MFSKIVLAKIKKIKIELNKILSNFQLGSNKSNKKGFGLEFDQIREYVHGDDFRLIHWSGAAKTGKLLTKQYLEDSGKNIIICLDVSASVNFSDSKKELLQNIAATLALISEASKDKIALILFSDKIEKIINCRSGKAHTNIILNLIFESKEYSKLTDLNVLLKYLMTNFSQKDLIFVISDFISNDYSKALKNCKNKNFVAFVCNDKLEINFDYSKLIYMQDVETNEIALMENISIAVKNFKDVNLKLLHENKIKNCVFISNENYIEKIIKFFRRRLIY